LSVDENEPVGDAAYERRKERSRSQQAEQSKSGRDIAPLPPVKDPARKAACRDSFRLFCESYYPGTFTLGWSPDHLRVIQRIETAIRDGGLFALAMPRGSGKTTLAEVACQWAVLYGFRRFVALIGADEGSASELLESIKSELANNELLLEDFPECVYPIHAIDGIAHRCKGQLHKGERTQIQWAARKLVMPTIPDSPASGAIIKIAGITGRIRGMKHKTAAGDSYRPDLVIVDDPQTDESARSAGQCASRESILSGAILGLAGPGKKISGIMPCTVIRPGDMADRLLNRQLHPIWQGERAQLVYAWPIREDLWNNYAEIRAKEFQDGGNGAQATEFYRSHRAEMDEGARVAWEERFAPGDELSALQHAYNLRLRDERAFMAEYQNDPLPDVEETFDILTAGEIAAKCNGFARGELPTAAGHVTAFIDVQKTLLYWLVAAWQDDFTGYVLDYGAFPDQKLNYFTLNDARRTLALEYPNTGQEGWLMAGFKTLVGDLVSRKFVRDDGAELSIEKLLVDANWGESTDVVYSFCRQSGHSTIVTPSHGKFFGASSVPMDQYKKKPGEKVGLNWRMPVVRGTRSVRHVVFDTNFWKSFIHSRLAVAIGDASCLSLYHSRSLQTHQMLADQLTAETPIQTEGRGRKVTEWKLKPDRPDNHLFDCLVGSAVAASMVGVGLPESKSAKPVEKEPAMKLSEIWAKKQAGG